MNRYVPTKMRCAVYQGHVEPVRVFRYDIDDARRDSIRSGLLYEQCGVCTG